MRFITDECVSPAVAAWLVSIGHDVVSVFETARGAQDAAILTQALVEDRIVVTADKDFGEQVFSSAARA